MDVPTRLLEELGIAVSEKQHRILRRRFVDEMNRGLAGRPSSLAMIPSHYTTDNPPSRQPAVVIDAGGSRLRCARLETTAHGRHELHHFRETPLPGASAPVSCDAFFSRLADLIAPICSKGIRIGFCFSYPMTQLEDHDAIVTGLTKEISIEGIVGRRIGRTLRNVLNSRDIDTDHIAVLNDTVATLLAGVVDGSTPDRLSPVGLIVGTGTNMAYVEANENIPSSPLEEGTQIINCESGGFALVHGGAADAALDASSADPGQQRLEKMVSGRYLGPLLREILAELARKNKLNPSLQRILDSETALSAKHLSEWMASRLSRTNPLNTLPAGEKLGGESTRMFTGLIRALIERSASLAAVCCSAALTRRAAGGDALISYDGSLIDQFPGYLDCFRSWLTRLVDPAEAATIRIIHPQSASLTGAGIAARMC